MNIIFFTYLLNERIYSNRGIVRTDSDKLFVRMRSHSFDLDPALSEWFAKIIRDYNSWCVTTLGYKVAFAKLVHVKCQTRKHVLAHDGANTARGISIFDGIDFRTTCEAKRL